MAASSASASRQQNSPREACSLSSGRQTLQDAGDDTLETGVFGRQILHKPRQQVDILFFQQTCKQCLLFGIQAKIVFLHERLKQHIQLLEATPALPAQASFVFGKRPRH